jgi:phospholipid/cholesterol/gamma-HCH transport system substrate-binding protein
MLRDSAQYDQLQATFADLRKTVATLRNGSMLQSDQLYRDWSGSLESLMRSVDTMNASPLFTSSDTYDNLNGFAREMEKTMREFRQDPRKFLRLKVF